MGQFLDKSPYDIADGLLASGTATDWRQALMMAVIMWSDIDEKHKDLHLAIAQNYGPDFQIWELSPDEQKQLEADHEAGELTFTPKGRA
jgi:hypothetical protein